MSTGCWRFEIWNSRPRPCSHYSINPCSIKLYHDHWKIYWWDSLKRDIAEFVAKCQNCQQVKSNHLKSVGLTQIMDVPTCCRKPSTWNLLLGFLEHGGKIIWYGLLWIGWPTLPTLFPLSPPIQLKIMKESRLLIFWSFMGFFFPSSWIEVSNSHIVFWKIFKTV